MTGSTFEFNDKAAKAGAETPLESWKEIAAYLQRDVKTAHRWERYEGLPVHRHHHLSRSSVYAYPSELEAWRTNRRPLAESTRSTWWRPVPAFASMITFALALMMAGSGPHIGALVQAADGTVTRLVWSGTETATQGAPSPDGRYLAFVDNETGDLAVRDLTTGQNRRLTNKKGGGENSYGNVYFPVFSPDGEQVAFGWYNQKGDCELRVVGLDGSEPRIVSDAEWHEFFPVDWSQDGESILALLRIRTGRTGPAVGHTAIVDVVDGSLSILKIPDAKWHARTPTVARNARFSPDGRFVVYDSQADEEGNLDIFVLSVASRQATPLIEDPAEDRVLDWAPDGSSVLFLSDRTGNWGAWLAPIAGGKPQGEPRIAKRDIGAVRPMGFTRDGSFYYVLWDHGNNVYTARLDTGTPSLLVNRHLGANSLPAWSRDGNYVAYVSRRSRGLDPSVLCVRSMSTGKERVYDSSELVPYSLLQWSPDGRSILSLANRLDLETGDVDQVLTRQFRYYIVIPRWSADGKAVYYIEPWEESTQRAARLMRRDLETGREEQLRLFQEGVRMGWVYPSPDGRWLALWLLWDANGKENLAVMPTGETEIRELPIPLAGVNRGTLTWAPDSRQILLIRKVSAPGGAVRSELWGAPVDGGKPRTLGFSVPQAVETLSIHPDGKQLAFHVREATAEVWVMENFLPGSESAGQ